MLLKVYKSRVWVLLFMLLPIIGNAQIAGLPDGWGFTLNPTSGTYAVKTDVMYDGVDPLAAGDWIGAFYNDGGVLECGGAIQWDGINNVAVVVFGNDTLAGDKNGFSEGELIQWKFYRDVAGVEEEVFTEPEFHWTNGALPEITKFWYPSGCEQYFSFNAGFNWISFNVLPTEGADLNTVLGAEGYTQGDFIQTAGGSAQYFAGYGWYGATLTAINPDKCTTCTPSSPKIRSRSKSLTLSVLPTSPALSF